MLDNYKLNSAAMPLRVMLQIAGKRCALETNDMSVLRSVDAWICPGNQAADLGLNVLVHDRPTGMSSTPVFRGMDHLMFASFGHDYFGFDLIRRKIVGVVSRERAKESKFWNTVLLPIAIGVMGCVIGVIPMHCACLDWKGSGVLIAGRCGAGKSTLSAAMGKHGFAFVSDDWTYVSRIGHSLAAHGLDAPIKLLPDANRFFDDLRRFPIQPAMNGELAYEVNPSDLSFNTELLARPRHLLLLERTLSGGPAYTPIRPEEVKGFFESASERLPDSLSDARQLRSSIIDEVSRLDCWKFTYSGSPHEAADSIRCFLETC